MDLEDAQDQGDLVQYLFGWAIGFCTGIGLGVIIATGWIRKRR